ncbi:Fc receptor-like protein 5, partial [Silurus asotus]
RPKPVVRVLPAKHVFIGETVTLTCYILLGGSWKYHWFSNNNRLSDAAGKRTYTMTVDKESDKGSYICNGTQSSDPEYTQSSDEVTLTVAVSGSTCNISSLSPSHTGVYWCQSESGERSKSAKITVH